jgi:hypothetical protein
VPAAEDDLHDLPLAAAELVERLGGHKTSQAKVNSVRCP